MRWRVVLFSLTINCQFITNDVYPQPTSETLNDSDDVFRVKGESCSISDGLKWTDKGPTFTRTIANRSYN